VLSKYHAYDYEGLNFFKISSPELVNEADFANTGKYALQYILA